MIPDPCFMEPKHAVRQCQYLQAEGKALVELSTQRSLAQTDFFDRLRPYVGFHQEMRAWLQQHAGHDELVMERVEQLPAIKFEDHSIRPEDWKSWLRIVIGAALGPFRHFFEREARTYIEETVHKIHHNNTLYGSLAVLLKNMPDPV